jgi:hypothetical protein
MSQTTQRFQSLITRVRPHRIAVLTNTEDPNWYHNCIGVIEFLTKLWGGSHCIIIPTDGKKIDEEFWSILSSHDPDILYRYQPTGADEKARAPEEFERCVSARAKEWAASSGLQEEQIRNQIEKAILDSNFDEWAISDELQNEILMRLAPFHFEKQPLIGMPDRQLHINAISKGSKPFYPLTALLDVLMAGNKPAQVTRIEVDDARDAAGAPPKLWFAATIGCGDDEYFQELSNQQINPVVTVVDESNADGMIRVGVRPWKYTVDSFPLGMTTAGLSWVRTGAARRYTLPTIVVVGDSLRDFCLYFNLYWQQGRALWLPPWFMPEDGKFPSRLITAVNQAEEAGRLDHNERLVLVSYSVPPGDLAQLKESIRAHIYRTSIDVEPISTQMVAAQVTHPSRIYTDGDIGNITTHMLPNNDIPGRFESPVPRTLNPANPLSHRWIVDVTFMQHLIPRHPALGQISIRDPNLTDVRSASGCVSYKCPGEMVLGGHMETNILRPSIHVPDAEEIFRAIFEDCGYRSRTSDKGRYEDATVQKFGGLEEVGYALWSEKHRTLLRKFQDTDGSRKGVFDQGVYLKDRRRYLDFQSMNKIFDSEDLTRRVIDEYVQKGILYRGFIFLCKNCADAAWYPIAELDQTFTCRRCGLKQQYKFENWKHPNEPSWFYKLDEMIYLMLEHNGHVPLLTLNKLRIQSEGSFLFRPEILLTRAGSTGNSLEADVCCIANGRLCIGEAKSTESLEGDKLTAMRAAERYRDLAIEIGASMAVFSTSAKAWNQASRDAMHIVFEKCAHIEVLKWASSTLYG